VLGFRSPSKIARRLRLTPLVARHLRNWPRFMVNYTWGEVAGSPYQFRNGARIQIGRGVDHVPIIEIFLREEYGTVADGSVILDIGANIGTFTVFAGTTARDVTIYAYEPTVEFFALLRENIRLNGLDRAVTCFNLAVGAETRVRRLALESKGFSFPTLLPSASDQVTRTVDVQTTSLADIFEANALEQVDLLKMDCEGAEYEILYGTPARYLERIREIRMEYHRLPAEGCNKAALMAFLDARGYRITMAMPADANGNLWARRHD
jgi:FkbM family methyltransferase